MTEPLQVVISYYDARPIEPLLSLLARLRELDAGGPFDVRVVVNRHGGERPLGALPGNPEVLYRENAGYNISAWDAGWRPLPRRETYLFLQDDCRLLRPGWGAAFRAKAAEPGVGLVGERFNDKWAATWEDVARKFRGHRMPGHEIDGVAVDRLDCYLHFFKTKGILPGPRADHLQTLVLCARRDVLEAVGGFPAGRNYGEAIAAEIAISKIVESRGWKTAQVGAAPFTYFDHPQWAGRDAVRAGAKPPG